MARAEAGSDNLTDLWSAFQTALASRGLRLYPGTPLLENDERLAVADWPDEDWGAFLDIAEAVGARLVYAEAVEADRETLDELIANIEHYDPDGQHARLVKQLDGHLGDLYRVEAGFMNQGLYHQWATEADWWVAAEGLLAELRSTNEVDDDDDELDGEDEQRRALYDRIESEGWVKQIARDRRFIAAEPWSGEEEQIVAELLGAFLNEAIEPRGDARSLVHRVSSHARRTFQSEVRQELQDEVMEQVPQLATELAQLHSDWTSTTMPFKEDWAKRLIKERFGYPFPLVAKRIARYKAPAADRSLFSS